MIRALDFWVIRDIYFDEDYAAPEAIDNGRAAIDAVLYEVQSVGGFDRIFAWLFANEFSDVPPNTDGRVAALEHFLNEMLVYLKNRLSVARALLHDPELLFLDEPTAGLDPVNALRIKDIIRQEKQAGKTIFLATHDMSAADELCDRVAFIVDGRIACIDAPGDLKLAHGERTVRVEIEEEGSIRSRDFSLDGLASNTDFIQTLSAGTVRTMHSREATLADVFIKVTGRGLE